jgi:hypothetical protein
LSVSKWLARFLQYLGRRRGGRRWLGGLPGDRQGDAGGAQVAMHRGQQLVLRLGHQAAGGNREFELIAAAIAIQPGAGHLRCRVGQQQRA